MPKPSATRRRHTPAVGPTLVKLPVSGRPGAPVADPDWHPVIRQWWEALVASPQTREFYVESDWGFAYYLAARESINLSQSRPSAQASAIFVAAQADLLVTEGSRRRLRIELERGMTTSTSDLQGTMARWGIPHG